MAESSLRTVALLAGATTLYLAYHLAISKPSVSRLFAARLATLERPAATRPALSSSDALSTITSWFRKALGVVLLGLLPAVPMALSTPAGLHALGLNLDHLDQSLLWTGVALAVFLPVIALSSRGPAHRQAYPEVRLPFTPRIATWNAGAWAAFLLAYELFFRGFMLLGLAPLLGPEVALAVTTMAYVFVHLDKFAGEVLGTIFTGIGFGLVTLETGSILMPFLAHLAVAVTNDTLASRPRPRPA
jgi:membrane protease YdiL (CAAX protease family)